MDVFGTIRDAANQTPVGDAEVTLSVDSNELAVLHSDSKGQFEYRDAGSYLDQTLTCLVEKQGYEKREVTQEIKQDVLRLEIEMALIEEKTLEVRLSVSDEKGNALEGVGITLKVGEEQVGSGHSDKAGLFKASLSQSYEGKTLTYTAQRLLYKTETGQVQLTKETSAEITMKKVAFPLWAKIAAGIAALVVVVLLVLQLMRPGAVTVPDVVGATEARAATILEEAGLRKGTVGRRPSSATQGTVIAQQPSAGNRVRKGSAVALVLASPMPQERVKVPSVIGRTESQAAAMLTQAGLRKGGVSSRPSSATRGTVIEQQPSAGNLVRQGTEIALVLASPMPQERVKVPSVIGRTESQAAAILTKVGLRKGTVGRRPSSATQGTVIAQKPSAGNQVPRGTAVALVLASPMPIPPVPTDDCLGYNPRALRIVNEGARGWLLTDGQSRMLMLDNQEDAKKALALARRHTRHCFIGRGNQRPNRKDYIVEYWMGNSGTQTSLGAEDCIAYNPSTLRIVDEGAQGWLLTDGRSRMLMLDNEEDARKALALAQNHTQQCFIGRNNQRPNRKDYIVEYWK
jgi:beta-lactam-binding protein with PASTA domain